MGKESQDHKDKREAHKTQGEEGPWEKGQAGGGWIMELRCLQASSSETVNLTLLPAKIAVPRTLRLLVAQSFHFL